MSHPVSHAEVLERLRLMLDTEADGMPRPDYIENVQRDGMRAMWRYKVATWLLEFEEAYGLSQETVALAVNLMDRYLSRVSTKRSIVQLLGMSAIFVAAKLLESAPLRMQDLKELALDAYSEPDLRLMELELLRVLQWRLSPVTPQACMEHLVQLIPCPEWRHAAEEDALTFLDVTIPEYEFLCFKPSEQAAAALLCSLESIGATAEVVAAFVANAAPLGVLTQPQVAQCKLRMQAIFESLVPGKDLEEQQAGADAAAGSSAAASLSCLCPPHDGRAMDVVSPTNVEDVAIAQQNDNEFDDDFACQTQEWPPATGSSPFQAIGTSMMSDVDQWGQAVHHKPRPVSAASGWQQQGFEQR